MRATSTSFTSGATVDFSNAVVAGLSQSKNAVVSALPLLARLHWDDNGRLNTYSKRLPYETSSKIKHGMWKTFDEDAVPPVPLNTATRVEVHDPNKLEKDHGVNWSHGAYATITGPIIMNPKLKEGKKQQGDVGSYCTRGVTVVTWIRKIWDFCPDAQSAGGVHHAGGQIMWWINDRWWRIENLYNNHQAEIKTFVRMDDPAAGGNPNTQELLTPNTLHDESYSPPQGNSHRPRLKFDNRTGDWWRYPWVDTPSIHQGVNWKQGDHWTMLATIIHPRKEYWDKGLDEDNEERIQWAFGHSLSESLTYTKRAKFKLNSSLTLAGNPDFPTNNMTNDGALFEDLFQYPMYVGHGCAGYGESTEAEYHVQGVIPDTDNGIPYKVYHSEKNGGENLEHRAPNPDEQSHFFSYRFKSSHKTRKTGTSPQSPEAESGGLVIYGKALTIDELQAVYEGGPAAHLNENTTGNKPVILLVGGDMTIGLGGTYTEPGYTVYDAEDSGLSDQVQVGGLDGLDMTVIGTYTLTYDVTDSHGNAADQVTRTVDVVVNIPAITLMGDNPMSVTVNTPYTEPGYRAYDEEDGNITSQVTIVDNVNVNNVGTYTVTYDVTDSDGHEAVQVTRTVNVVPDGALRLSDDLGGSSGGLGVFGDASSGTGPFYLHLAGSVSGITIDAGEWFNLHIDRSSYYEYNRQSAGYFNPLIQMTYLQRIQPGEIETHLNLPVDSWDWDAYFDQGGDEYYIGIVNKVENADREFDHNPYDGNIIVPFRLRRLNPLAAHPGNANYYIVTVQSKFTTQPNSNSGTNDVALNHGSKIFPLSKAQYDSMPEPQWAWNQ